MNQKLSSLYSSIKEMPPKTILNMYANYRYWNFDQLIFLIPSTYTSTVKVCFYFKCIQVVVNAYLSDFSVNAIDGVHDAC